jgi:hypothetical protein
MYEKEFKLKLNGQEQTLLLRPLSGAYIGKFYKVISRLSQAEGKTDKDFLSLLDEDTMTTLHSLVMATMRKSYPDKYKDEDLDELVSQHIMLFIEPLMKLNMPQQ